MLDRFKLLQPAVSDLISNQIASDTLPEAMLFCGPADSGKLLCAFEIAKQLGSVKGGNFVLCTPRDFSPYLSFALERFSKSPSVTSRKLLVDAFDCYLGHFHSTLTADDKSDEKFERIGDLVQHLSTVGTVEDAATLCRTLSADYAAILKAGNRRPDSLSIAQVRSLRNWLYLTNTDRQRKVVVIDAIDEANDAVKNSLLKMLEEPPQRALFILISKHPQRVMTTILSRTRRCYFPPVPAKQVRAFASYIGISLPEDGDYGPEELLEGGDGQDLPVKGFFDEGYDLMPLIKASDDPVQLRLLFRALTAEVRRLVGEGRIGENRCAQWIGRINEAANRCEVYNQNPRLAIQGLFFSIGGGRQG